jgi:hypothetical protein
LQQTAEWRMVQQMVGQQDPTREPARMRYAGRFLDADQRAAVEAVKRQLTQTSEWRFAQQLLREHRDRQAAEKVRMQHKKHFRFLADGCEITSNSLDREIAEFREQIERREREAEKQARAKAPKLEGTLLGKSLQPMDPYKRDVSEVYADEYSRLLEAMDKHRRERGQGPRQPQKSMVVPQIQSANVFFPVRAD